MKSNARLTKQGIPDLNYYGPRPKPVALVEETPATIRDELTNPVGEAVEGAAEADVDVPPIQVLAKMQPV
jgi:hypothetical protein